METNEIEFTNEYAKSFFGIENDTSPIQLFTLLSNATNIFYESYIRPTLISHGICTEIQITLLSKATKKTPTIANIQLFQGKLHWAIYTAETRDKLYQELILAREHLEDTTDKLTLLTRLDPLTSLLNRRAAEDDINKRDVKDTKRIQP